MISLRQSMVCSPGISALTAVPACFCSILAVKALHLSGAQAAVFAAASNTQDILTV